MGARARDRFDLLRSHKCTGRTTHLTARRVVGGYFHDVPPNESLIPRAAGARRAKPILVGEFTSGAVLGALIWLALRTFGLHDIFSLSGSSGVLPAALLGGLLGLSRFRPLLWVVAAALTVLFTLVSYTPIIVQPAQALVRSDPIPSSPLGLDAIVVLSLGVSADGLISPDAADRLLSGLQLAKVTATRDIVVTRVRNSADPEITSEADQRNLVKLAGSELRLFVVSDVQTTRDEALLVRDLARRRGWGRVAVVTSPAHSRRACGTFEKVGMRVTCVPAESRRIAFETLASPDDRVKAFGLWAYELAGTAKYRLRGWLP